MITEKNPKEKSIYSRSKRKSLRAKVMEIINHPPIKRSSV